MRIGTMAIKAMAILTLVLGRGPMDMAVVTVELPLCRNWIIYKKGGSV